MARGQGVEGFKGRKRLARSPDWRRRISIEKAPGIFFSEIYPLGL